MIAPVDAVRKPQVLLAEDNQDLRELLAEIMIALGTDVEAVPDGGRFLVSIAAHYREGHTFARVDLIVTDVGMPVCSGLDVLGALRAVGWGTPAIVITGLPTPMARARASRLGATLLTKPLDLALFQGTVLELLASRPAEGDVAVSSRHGQPWSPPS